MTTEETVTVNKKDLIEAFLEIEREYSRAYFLLFRCVEQVDQIYHNLRSLMGPEWPCVPQSRLSRLVFPDKEVGFPVTDEILDRWDEEFEAQYSQVRYAAIEELVPGGELPAAL